MKNIKQMKHLKLFEGYLDSYYTKITEEEWLDLLDDLDDSEESDAFPEKSEARLRELIDGEVNIDRSVPYISGRLDIIAYCIKDIYHRNPYGISIDYVNDDYYIVCITNQNINLNRIDRIDKYWKCDQFEGLIKLLKDKGFIY